MTHAEEKALAEQMLRDQPKPKTLDELTAYVKEQTERTDHDYDTSAKALADCAVAAFNYAARAMGNSGFQASYATLAFLQMTRWEKGPFALLRAEDMLYPQYDDKIEKYQEGWADWLAAEAKANIAQDDERKYTSPHGLGAHDSVRARWEELAGA